MGFLTTWERRDDTMFLTNCLSDVLHLVIFEGREIKKEGSFTVLGCYKCCLHRNPGCFMHLYPSLDTPQLLLHIQCFLLILHSKLSCYFFNFYFRCKGGMCSFSGRSNETFPHWQSEFAIRIHQDKSPFKSISLPISHPDLNCQGMSLSTRCTDINVSGFLCVCKYHRNR